MDVSSLPLVAVVGLTASGKSGFSLHLARALGERGIACEIISADAFQLYRGMDIGTAKVSLGERGGIPHHLLDVLELEEKASVAAYQRSCRQVINEIRARKALPILVGGSGLYVRAALDEIEFPGTDSAVRERITDQAAQLGAETMHQRLAEVDPESAARILPSNLRRVIRALEVYELTGKKFSATMPRREYFQPTLQLGISWPLTVLDERISERTSQMLAHGFIEEVAELEKQGLADTPGLPRHRLPGSHGLSRRKDNPGRSRRTNLPANPASSSQTAQVVPQRPQNPLARRRSRHLRQCRTISIPTWNQVATRDEGARFFLPPKNLENVATFPEFLCPKTL